jgi:hypothetical protein
VTGHDTMFEKEVAAGDALLCIVSGGGNQVGELRVVTMRLSNESLNLLSGFSESLKHPVEFQYIPKPRDAIKDRREAQTQAQNTQQEQETHAFDLYGNAASLVYREKTETGSYRIKREKIDRASREDILYMRSKKTSDKYC